MSIKSQRVQICLTIGLLLMCMASSANAVYIAGLDWLPFRYTLGLSWNTVFPMLEPGGILEGWRYATRPEIESLYTALHPGWVGNEWHTANKGITDAIGLVLGYTTYNPDTEFRMIDAIAWPSGGGSLVSNYRIIISDPYAPADTEFAGLGEAITIGASTAYGRYVASFLVRDIPTETDSDGDGIPDEEDAFPDDPTEWADTDGDGVGDNGDVFPDDPDEWADTDGDGVGDNSDAFPEDPDEWDDVDGDGVGDNADQNDDSDLRETVTVGGSETGVPNVVDDSGLSIQDYLNEIEAQEFRNHGQYVSMVAHLVEDLLDAGLITEDDADIMMSCAAKSKIGKKGGKK